MRERRKKRELADELNRSAMRELGAGRRAGRWNRSTRKRGEKRLGSVTLRPVEAWAGDVEAGGVVERERRKKRELAGELNRLAMRELGAG